MKTAIIASVFCLSLFAVQPDQKNLPIGLAPHEKLSEPARDFPSLSPLAPVHSLPEWESSDGVMTLWTNPSLVKALQSKGNVKLFADSRNEQTWWESWLSKNNIPDKGVTYFIVQTDSMWIRDYGPWFIIDGKNNFGIVDTKYNRPRPHDDLVPGFISKEMNIPLYAPGLVHTGGNYYNDGVDRAFSSTLVYSENSSLSKETILTRMKDFLGIEQYTTSDLGKHLSIEHIDTFGKIVSPDTWVFSDFPANSKFKKDSDRMADLLSKMVSPNGTPYKILRMKMILRPGSSGEDYRAYINSFVSNHALYYPTYGDESDEYAKKVYQEALPGYDIIGVEGGSTEWGDSVHCRTRNILTRNSVFLFPKISTSSGTLAISGDFIANPDAQITEITAYIRKSGEEFHKIPFTLQNGNTQSIIISDLESGSQIELYLEAKDSKNSIKRYPRFAPTNLVKLVIP